MAEQGSKTTSWWRRFRWLYAVRCTLACVVTLVAVAVIVRAVVVMLRPEKLQMKLAGGHVAVDYIPSLPPPGNEVWLKFVLRAYNPSGRATLEYANVTVRLTDASAAATAPAARITEFNLTDPVDVAQQTMREATTIAGLEPPEDLPMRYVRALYEGRSVAGAEMELSGILSTHVAMSTTSVLTTYYCWPVTIAVGPGDQAAPTCPASTSWTPGSCVINQAGGLGYLSTKLAANVARCTYMPVDCSRLDDPCMFDALPC